jgi:hypothetical protein
MQCPDYPSMAQNTVLQVVIGYLANLTHNAEQSNLIQKAKELSFQEVVP